MAFEFRAGEKLGGIVAAEVLDGGIVVVGVAGVNSTPSSDGNGVDFLRPGGIAAFGTGGAVEVAFEVSEWHDWLAVDGFADGSGSGFGGHQFSVLVSGAKLNFTSRCFVVLLEVFGSEAGEEGDVQCVGTVSGKVVNKRLYTSISCGSLLRVSLMIRMAISRCEFCT